ncbi:MAG: hypothetical protein ACOVQI_11800, partial [Tagaea sp.]
FSYPWSGSGARRRYLLGCLKAFLKAGFQRKFYDLGRVDYWGPQSKRNVDFRFDPTRTRESARPLEAVGDTGWRTVHDRKPKAVRTGPAACGGGKEQLAETQDALPPAE